MTPSDLLAGIEPAAWQPRYKQDVIDHLRSIGGKVWDYAMTVYSSRDGAESYGLGDHEVRALYDTASLAPLLERVEKAEAERDEAVAALKPFASFHQQAEGFVQARAEQGGSPILPTKHFCVDDFRRAAALTSKHRK